MKAVLKFNPAITFEGNEIKEIDLSPAENWTSATYNSVLSKMRASGYDPKAAAIENTAEFAWFAGNELTGYPVEFFKSLPVKYIRAMNLVFLKNFTLTDSVLQEILTLED